ncbi:sensor histidine kinase N-terminal domain-containing protein [Rhodoferax sp. AJA081-3]|uniref:sensor histidine kinase n=1 Tax=Rhodoferax sp. AJA081-3 TaxID=2752316 RepID=UPI001ADF6765|nr:sensor histidine kinase [Rhodoferax sp. AJA081-3]QTN29263.1 sensor histidine kinase N-terminal domain-containing protein [Rhodoferax sp. AJA081-3]
MASPHTNPRPISLRRHLLVGILLPIVLFVVVDTYSLYRQALNAVNIAYDRTLLASAKAIGELLEVDGVGDQAVIRAQIPYSALEAFEADNRSRMSYRVSDAKGKWIDGVQDLPQWTGTLPNQGPYAALVDFYDETFRGDAVRVAVLLQPVASTRGQAMATVQVAETLELRHTLARKILLDTLLRQMLLISVITAVVLVVVHRVTAPVRRLSDSLRQRDEDDLTPLEASDIPREIQPLTDATNQVMQRLQHTLDHQKRFVRDAAHQLRTPLAVLKVQVQSALRGDVAAPLALQEIQVTVDRATALANQMLSLAKVEQVRQMQDFVTLDWAEVVRAVALDVSPLIAEKDIDFELVTLPCSIHAHDWMLRELTRNLLHNAARHTPTGGQLSVRIQPVGDNAQLVVADTGSGISEDMRQRLFQPFATGDTKSGTGLGLTIAREIVQALDGSIQLNNRLEGGRIVGLDACITLPLNNPPQ